uniref:Reverse transcriptase domain-containing protein n=1 Tax=Tanacetum cinerariifolium TaxID=118510 RepID=A0A6L2KQW5_TANCI|nr:reverse transcriptase domain-containing protein [Tanacetum cinerariifolium]
MAQQEKLKAVKARLNFEEASRYSESETPSRRRNLKERLGPRLGDKEKNAFEDSRGSKWKSYYSSRRDTESCYQSSRSKETEIAFKKHRHKREYSRRMKAVSEKTDPFTPRIHYFDFSKAQMPGHIKTYDGSEDPKDHLKIFQAASKAKRWAIPTWCHMFKSTLTGNVRKKCIKDPLEIHNIKQRNGESTEEFVWRYKLEDRDVKGAPECMKISRFMNGITNPELIKQLHDKIPKSIDEIMSITTTFLRGGVAASNRERRSRFHPGNRKPDKSKTSKGETF